MLSNAHRWLFCSIAAALLFLTVAAPGDPRNSESPNTAAVDELVGELIVPKDIAGLFAHPASIGDPAAILKNPGKFEAFRIAPHIDLTAEKTFAGYQVLSGPSEIDVKLAGEISAALLDPKTYDFPGGGSDRAGCGFAPGIVIRFSEKQTDPKHKPNRVAVFFCFLCNGMDVSFSHSEYKQVASFEPGRAPLVKLMKRAFPKDKVVQALTEETPAEPPAEEGPPE